MVWSRPDIVQCIVSVLKLIQLTVRLTMNNLGEPVTEAEVKSMIDEADLDGDGKINFNEYNR